MGANLFISKTYNVGDKVRAEKPACPKPQRKVKNNMTREELKRKLINMESVSIDYTRCFNCGSKRKQSKWKLTHFCSLKCFCEWEYKSVAKYLYGDADMRYAQDFWREEGLLN